MQHIENLIVGLGIAGINLCHQLEQAGSSFRVIDKCPENSASLIAGGIYNPIGIKRKVKSWKVDTLFEHLSAYDELEAKLGTKLFHQLPILKPISSEQELPEWKSAIDEQRLTPYVNTFSHDAPTGPFQPNVIGSVTIKNAGLLNMGKAVIKYREYLQKKGLLTQETFDHYNIEDVENGIAYGGDVFERIIFCEGRFLPHNPFFNWIPLNPTKGQMLTVKINPILPSDKIYNQQFFMTPTSKAGVFRLGATYEWHNLNEEPTEIAKEELISKVKKALNVNIEVLNQKAAIRPNMSDRRPVIGKHPDNERIVLFNGMGSKGVMLAPFFAKQLVDHIYKGSPIDKEVDLNRFIKRYRKSLISN